MCGSCLCKHVWIGDDQQCSNIGGFRVPGQQKPDRLAAHAMKGFSFLHDSLQFHSDPHTNTPTNLFGQIMQKLPRKQTKPTCLSPEQVSKGPMTK